MLSSSSFSPMNIATKVEATFLGEALMDVVNLCSGQGENVEVGESQFSPMAISNKQISNG